MSVPDIRLAPAMEFRLLGPLEVVVDHRPVPLRAGKQRVLLSLLLLNANRVVSAADLIHYLWENNSPANGRAALQVHVARLRTFLSRSHSGGESLIQTTPDGYLIKLAPEQLDLSRFLAAAARAGQARERGNRALELTHLTEALAQWRGRALALVPSDALLRDEAPPLEERRLRLVERRFEIELLAGNHADIVGELRAFATEHSMQERLWGQLMLALYRCGRQAEALAAYREIAERLREEVGVDPGPALRKLYQAILTAAPELTAPVNGPAPKSHRDESRQLWKVQRQLPSDTGEFVGRSEIQRQALALLDPAEPGGGVPIITLTGSPGVGKTALAIRLAHQARVRYPDGQWYVQMGGTGGKPCKTVDVLRELLRNSGLNRSALPEDLDSCAAIFRAWLADRRVLLVFDDALSTEQIRHLLPGTPGCAVIVTCRPNLSDLVAFHGARMFALDVLSFDESQTLLARMLGMRRVRAEPAAVTELIKLCAQLPLALRIAGASLAARQHHAVSDYVTELRRGNRLSALTIGSDSRAAIRVAFELSYRALTAPARRLFRCLGPIPTANFSVPVAAELAEVGQDEAGALLNALADAHLVETHAVGRYHFHDLLRLYAVECSINEEDATYRDRSVRRVCEWYLYTADAAIEAYNTGFVRMPLPDAPVRERVHQFAGSREAQNWLDSERANLVAVIVAAAEHNHNLGELSILLADTLRGYFQIERRYADWVTAAGAGLRAALRRQDRYAASAMRLGLGLAYQGLNRLQEADEQIDDALAGFRERGTQDFEACGLNAAAMLGLQRPTLRIDDALPMLERALRVSERLGLRQTEAQTRRNLGIVYHANGQLRDALACFNATRQLYAELAVQPPMAETLGRLGLVFHDLGDNSAAMEHLERALSISEYLDACYDTAIACQGMALVHSADGEYELAEQRIQQALDLSREHGYRAVELNSANILAMLQRLTGREVLANETYQHNVEFARRIGHPQGEATALLGLAQTHHDLGRYHAAVGYAQHAVRTAAYPGFRLVEGRALVALATAWHKLDEHTRAAEVANQAIKIFTACGYDLGVQQSRHLSQQISLRLAG